MSIIRGVAAHHCRCAVISKVRRIFAEVNSGAPPRENSGAKSEQMKYQIAVRFNNKAETPDLISIMRFLYNIYNYMGQYI